MNVILLASALSLFAPVKVTVNAKDGDLIAGDRAFRVLVQSDNPVTKVEFYVGGEFRADDSSTPYEFSLDALAEKEGPLEVKFKAYTSESEQGEVTLKLVVNNGLDKGVDFHAKRAADFLRDSKFDDVLTEGRIIMKIDPKSNVGRVFLARANYGKGVLDKAQKFAEDASAEDKGNTDALEVLAAINLQRAFKTYRRGENGAETLATIKSALKGAAEARKRSLDIQLERIGTPNDTNLIAYADAAIRANRFSLVPVALEIPFRKDERNTAIGNRLAYALMRSGKSAEASKVLGVLAKNSALNAYSYSLKAILDATTGSDLASSNAAAKASITEGLIADGSDLGLLTAQAFIALQRTNDTGLSAIASQLQKSGSQRYEVNYYLAALNNRLQNYPEASRYLRSALLAEPASAEVYVENANYSLGIALGMKPDDADRNSEFETAKLYYESALVARPESAEALSGLATVLLAQGKPNEAVSYASAAVNAQPMAAIGHFALAAAYNAQAKILRNGTGGAALNAALAGLQREHEAAQKLDKRNLEGRQVPTLNDLYRYLRGGGRGLFIASPR